MFPWVRTLSKSSSVAQRETTPLEPLLSEMTFYLNDFFFSVVFSGL